MTLDSIILVMKQFGWYYYGYVLDFGLHYFGYVCISVSSIMVMY